MLTKFRMVLLVICVGLISGICATFLGLLLKFIQHHAFGYSLQNLTGDESFLAGVISASSTRRLVIVLSAGGIAALGWWLLAHWGKKLISIAEEVKSPQRLMTFKSSISNILLQIVTVAMGSPLGREVAPRELAVLANSFLLRKLNISSEDCRYLLGCAAGAGLAAIYNVPLSGALFVLEGVLKNFQPKLIFYAMLSCSIATIISWLGLGDHLTYELPELIFNYDLLFWSLICGPVFGIVGYYFAYYCNLARTEKLISYWPACLLALFAIIAITSMTYPAVLGNGKSPVRLTFENDIIISQLFLLLLFRLFFVYGALKFGAKGGLLTPSLANGALIGGILGGFWQMMFPSSSPEIYSILGASAFLVASQRMPLTAVVLLVEFTHIKLPLILPIMLITSGSYATSMYLLHKEDK